MIIINESRTIDLGNGAKAYQYDEKFYISKNDQKKEISKDQYDKLSNPTINKSKIENGSKIETPDGKFLVKLGSDNYSVKVSAIDDKGRRSILKMNLKSHQRPGETYSTNIQEVEDWLSNGSKIIGKASWAK